MIQNQLSSDQIYEKLKNLDGSIEIIRDIDRLKYYSTDLSYQSGKVPILEIFPKSAEVIQKIIQFAISNDIGIVPVSSSNRRRYHGDTLSRFENIIILNLSKLDKILNIDFLNRVAMVQPGVTFKELIPKLKKKGLRLLLPLHPRSSKSVLTSALEREPILIPRYHWDSSDPLLCLEVIFGTGDFFKTGSAAGPGTIKEQWKSGQAQKNPMGPTQFSPFRVIQGAQGSLGIVTWASLKCEIIPSDFQIFHATSKNLKDLLKFQHELIKYRLCDETFILNNINLSCLLYQKPESILDFANDLPQWNLIFKIAGLKEFATERINYLKADMLDIYNQYKDTILLLKSKIDNTKLGEILDTPARDDWRLRLSQNTKDLLFITNFNTITKQLDLVKEHNHRNIGIYIQPINLGSSLHCEIDFYLDTDPLEFKNEYLNLAKKLIKSGAFFSRPYGIISDEIYDSQQKETIEALKKIKSIFDPQSIMNPGALCYRDFSHSKK